jgi:hypothetical protein
MNQFKKTHPIANAMLILLAKNDTCMRNTLSRHVHKISIVGAKDSAHRDGSFQMILVAIAQCP